VAQLDGPALVFRQPGQGVGQAEQPLVPLGPALGEVRSAARNASSRADECFSAASSDRSRS
jgi:hypothetical protein